MKVGIIAVQGAYLEHGAMLERLGAEYVFVRKKEDLDGVDRLILPGGESTAQRKLMRELEMTETIREMTESEMPVMGTCAGLILLADKIDGEESCLGGLPVKVVRNGYGRQLGSFSVSGSVGNFHDFPMRFIRAPYISEVFADDVRILNTADSRITAVRYKKRLGLAFHPELTEDDRIHRYFLSL